MGCNCHSTESEKKTFQYAAKLVCGILEKPDPLAVGQYRTAVNIHNPSRCDTVTLRWKVAIGASLSDANHLVTGLSKATLGPDEAIEIDCRDSMKLLASAGFKGKFAKGWVVVECDSEIDVVAVYTTSNLGDQVATAIHTDRVEPRCLARCEDLHFNASSGTAAWVLTAPDDNGEFASLGFPDSNAQNAWKPLPGATWIYDPDQAKHGDSVYQLCFDLCFGFENPRMSFDILADNRARVELNGQMLQGATYSAGGQQWHTKSGSDFSVPMTVTALPNMFKAGTNCVTVTVQNDSGPTGLAVKGRVDIDRGMCPGAQLPLLPCPGVCYMAYRRTVGWSGPNCNGETIGIPDPDTLGKRRIKAFKVWLTNSVPGMSIRYRAETESGTTPWTDNGQPCGNPGLFGKLFKIEVELINAPPHCRLEYRANNRGEGWSDWTTSGMAGSSGDRMDAFEIRIV